MRSEIPPGILLFFFQEPEQSRAPVRTSSFPLDALSTAEEDDGGAGQEEKVAAVCFRSSSVVAAASEVTKEKRWRSSYLGRGGMSETGEEEEGEGRAAGTGRTRETREGKVEARKKKGRCGQKTTSENEKATWRMVPWSLLLRSKVRRAAGSS